MIMTEFNGISNWQWVISLHQWLSEESLSLAHWTQSKGGKLWVNTPHLEKPDPTVSTTLRLGGSCSVSGGGGLVANSCDSQWRVARQAPLSMGFSRQEYWSGLNAALHDACKLNFNRNYKQLTHRLLLLRPWWSHPLASTEERGTVWDGPP